MNRSTVGYIKSLSNNVSLDIQKTMILRYCLAHNLSCDMFYLDTTYQKRKTADVSRAMQIGISATLKLRMLPAWEQLVMDIMDNKIGIIIVDNFVRLYRNAETKSAILQVCQKYHVQIIECGTDPFTGDSATKIAVYHYTDESQRHPLVVTNAVDSLYNFAAHSFPGSVCSLFLDTSLHEYEHPNYERLMESIKSFDIVLVHDIYRLSRRMGCFWSIAQRFYSSGVRIISVSEGPVLFSQDTEELQSKPLKIAIYDREIGMSQINTHELFLERCKLFIKYRTNWRIADIYLDKRSSPKQPKLQSLIDNKNAYDLILVDSFRKINDDTSQFYKFQSQVGIPLISLKEGSVF